MLPWKDSLYIALGVSAQATKRLTLRAGAAWDQTPARGAGAATPAIPDGDAYWLSAGAGYRLSESMWLDAALGATFTESVDVDLSAAMPGNAFRGDFAGQAEDAGAMFASIQMRIEF
jgi:long-chain fatty acid transport protein